MVSEIGDQLLVTQSLLHISLRDKIKPQATRDLPADRRMRPDQIGRVRDQLEIQVRNIRLCDRIVEGDIRIPFPSRVDLPGKYSIQPAPTAHLQKGIGL